MPVDSVCFRASCGLFLGTYLNFMAKRVVLVLKMRTRLVTVRNRLEAVFFVFVASYLLCCGDVEMNPGPTDSDSAAQHENTTDSDTAMAASNHGVNVSRITTSTPSQCAADSGVSKDLASQILETLRVQGERFQFIETNLSTMCDDIGSIKTDIGLVRTKCDEIGRRCDSLEKDTQKLTSSLNETKEDINNLSGVCRENEGIIRKMKNEIETLKENCDTLESFSRRDNLRMYGVPQTEKSENYDTCAKLVVDTLNSVEGVRKWKTDDIARAHRVGESREGQPKPMLIKFNRWKDKMAVITNRDFKDRLKEEGVRVANDLTRKQASIVAEARKEGKVAFFKRGKLTVAPRRPDSRTYAEVTAATDDHADTDARATAIATDTTATEQPADSDAEGRGQEQEGGRRDGDSPRRFSQDNQSNSARGARGQRGGRGGTVRGGRSGTDLHHFWSRQSSPPVNKGPANNARPRRTTRTQR